jgi:hypothetical protein
MFKYELGQTVFYMRETRIHSASVIQRNYNDEVTKVSEQTIKKIQYNLAGGWYLEASVFRSVDDLNFFLKSNIQAH